MGLTDSAIRNAPGKDKPYRIYDTGGLYVEVMPQGSKYFRLKYRFIGKEKRLALGVYPAVTLKEARARREEAKRHLANGIDPGALKKTRKLMTIERANDSFESIAREWFTKRKHTWSDSHAAKLIRGLERDIFPWLGGRPIAEITAPEIVSTLLRIEARGAIETTHKAKQSCGQIFRYAIANGKTSSDPTASINDALTPVTHKHFAAVTEPHKVGDLLRDIATYKGSFVVRSALALSPMLFLRPCELREARWPEIDLENALWTIPACRMKRREDHLVPLSRQALKILKEDLLPFSGHREFVFPGRNPRKPFSNNTVNKALRQLGYDTQEEITGHGFRAMARTILDEELEFRVDWIEHQLAHKVRDPLGRAYNRTKFLEGRRKMMQAWSDYLELLRDA